MGLPVKRAIQTGRVVRKSSDFGTEWTANFDSKESAGCCLAYVGVFGTEGGEEVGLVRVVELDLKQLSSFVGGWLPFPLAYGHLSGLRQQRMTSLNLDILYSAIGGY